MAKQASLSLTGQKPEETGFLLVRCIRGHNRRSDSCIKNLDMVKFLNFQMARKFCCYQSKKKFKQRGKTFGYFVKRRK